MNVIKYIQSKRLRNSGAFPKKKKGQPPVIIIAKTARSSFNSNNNDYNENHQNHKQQHPEEEEEDGISCMTPVTGIPQDSPRRILQRNHSHVIPPDNVASNDNNDDDDDDHSLLFLQQQQPLLINNACNANNSKPATGIISLVGNHVDHIISTVARSLSPTGVDLPPATTAAGRNNSSTIFFSEDDDDDDQLTVFENVVEEDVEFITSKVAVVPKKVNNNSSLWNTCTHQQQQQHVQHNDKSNNHQSINTTARAGNNIAVNTAAAAATINKRTRLNHVLRRSDSYLTRTTYFHRLVQSTFITMDTNHSNTVSCDELYAGMLLVHLHMAIYVGASACKPASRDYVNEIFILLDVNNSGVLEFEEFISGMKILYSMVLTRIVVQWSLTLLIVPVLSEWMIDWCNNNTYIHFLRIVDIFNMIYQLLFQVWTKLISYIPPRHAMASDTLHKISATVWKRLPLTLIMSIQTSLILPYLLSHVENLFLWTTDRIYTKRIKCVNESRL
jgi:hypothetical protein